MAPVTGAIPAVIPSGGPAREPACAGLVGAEVRPGALSVETAALLALATGQARGQNCCTAVTDFIGIGLGWPGFGVSPGQALPATPTMAWAMVGGKSRGVVTPLCGVCFLAQWSRKLITVWSSFNGFEY